MLIIVNDAREEINPKFWNLDKHRNIIQLLNVVQQKNELMKSWLGYSRYNERI